MSVTLNATDTLAENGYTTTDFTAAVVEGIINRAIRQVNLDAAQSISEMTGATVGEKTVSMTQRQSVPVTILISLMLRETRRSTLSNTSSTGNSSSTSKSINVGPIGMSDASSVSSAISASASLNNPANTIYRDDYLRAIDRLRGRGMLRTFG